MMLSSVFLYNGFGEVGV